jgi:hypothetical protein
LYSPTFSNTNLPNHVDITKNKIGKKVKNIILKNNHIESILFNQLYQKYKIQTINKIHKKYHNNSKIEYLTFSQEKAVLKYL